MLRERDLPRKPTRAALLANTSIAASAAARVGAPPLVFAPPARYDCIECNLVATLRYHTGLDFASNPFFSQGGEIMPALVTGTVLRWEVDSECEPPVVNFVDS